MLICIIIGEATSDVKYPNHAHKVLSP